MEIVVQRKKFLFQQKFQKKLHHLNGNSQLRVWCKKWSTWTSGVEVGQKNPTPTPSVVRNPNPTPPKNLWPLTTLTPAPTSQPCFWIKKNDGKQNIEKPFSRWVEYPVKISQIVKWFILSIMLHLKTWKYQTALGKRRSNMTFQQNEKAKLRFSKNKQVGKKCADTAVAKA